VEMLGGKFLGRKVKRKGSTILFHHTSLDRNDPEQSTSKTSSSSGKIIKSIIDLKPLNLKKY